MTDMNAPVEPTQHKYSRAAFPHLQPILLGVLFFVLYLTRHTFGMAKDNESTLEFLVHRWMTDQSATHGWLVIPIAVACVWYRRSRLKNIPLGSDKRGLGLIVLAILLHLGEIFFDIDGPSPLSIPIYLAGAVWYLCGTAWLRELSFPLVYLLFMIPVPGGLTQIVSAPLRILATSGSKWIVTKFFGLTILGAGMNMEFMQPYGSEYIRIDIADPCSGIHSLMAIKALHAITAYISRLKITWKWVLFWCALPITLAANIIRITLLILVCAYGERIHPSMTAKFGLGTFHDASPYPLFIIVLLLLISLGRTIEKLTRGEKFWKERQAAEEARWAAAANPPYSRQGQAPSFVLPIALTAMGLGIHLFLAMRPPFQAPLADVHQIPLAAGRWVSQGDDSVNAEMMKLQQADSYIYRVYQRDDGQRVELMVVYRRYGRREFAHRPEYCYPASGYVPVSSGTDTLPWAGREDKVVKARYDGAAVHLPITTVSYFFASGNRSESNFMKQQLWMALERLMPNKNGWTFIRLVSPRVTTDEDAFAAQKDFMKAIEPEIRKVITTDQETAGKVGA
jgi:EpsI family protein